jgi:hypothetical protein
MNLAEGGGANLELLSSELEETEAYYEMFLPRQAANCHRAKFNISTTQI